MLTAYYTLHSRHSIFVKELGFWLCVGSSKYTATICGKNCYSQGVPCVYIYIHQGGLWYIFILQTHNQCYVNPASTCDEWSFYIAIETIVKTIIIRYKIWCKNEQWMYNRDFNHHLHVYGQNAIVMHIKLLHTFILLNMLVIV